MKRSKQIGFSLLELLIVISILAILVSVSAAYYRNFARSRDLEIAAKTILFNLKLAQSKAIAGEDQMKWGIHFINGPATNDDYYEIFSSPTTYADASTVIIETVYLPSLIVFSDPLTDTTKDILFDRIKGSIAVQSTIAVSQEGNSKTITINAQGNIY